MVWPLEWFALIVLGIVSFVDTMRSGPNRSIAISLALLTSTFLYDQLPSTVFLGPILKAFGSFQGIIFLIFFALLIVLFLRIISPFNANSTGPLLAGLTALATVVLLIVIWIHTPALEALYHMSAPMQFLFTAPYSLLWTLGALVVFALVRS